MNKTLFNWNSQRARLSRYGRSIHSWRLVITLAAYALIVTGVVALLAGLPLGWLLVGLASLPAMILQWYGSELSSLPRHTAESIDARLDTELLSLMSPDPSPKELALALNETKGGIFFEVRFGLGGGFFKEFSSDNSADTEPIFREALRIATEGDGRVSAGVLILSMLRQLPMRKAVLGHLQLTESDIEAGIQWYHRLTVASQQRVSKVAKQPGGIGRDWSFGWIPMLSRFGVSLAHAGTISRNEVRTPQVQQVLHALSSESGTIGIIGGDGVGKTELLNQVAATLMQPDSSVPRGLWYRQLFMLDVSRILAAGSERGAVEHVVSTILGEAFDAKNIIVCFDNAELFFQDGVGSVDISNLLTPIVEARRLPILMTIDEQNFLKMSQQKPALANAMTRIVIQPTNEENTLRILEDHIPFIEYSRKVTYMYQSLKSAYQLSQRYVYDVSMPGQAIRLLEQSAEHAEEGRLVSARSVSQAIEHMTGVKTAVTSGETERETLLNLEARLHERMVGQDRAVSVVSDALRRARSGVRNQGRPLGTFLFLGPTGVGKTELAKSLAEVYFGGEDTIIRLDMNEFVSPHDVARLIADGTEDAGSLTAQVMKQPFSVVLLDELEKAHSSVLTTLLQLLDEGVLRDVRGREVSFRDTVVIATSNAGADRIQEYIERGYTLQQFEETFINELIGSHIFHPEFLNRFDEMVVFSPLSKIELLSVVDLILEGLNKNLSSRQITVRVTDDAKRYLVEKGYDPRLGARPMRRVVQRAVESTVATLLLSGSATPGSVIDITESQVASVLDSALQATAIASDTNGGI